MLWAVQMASIPFLSNLWTWVHVVYRIVGELCRPRCLSITKLHFCHLPESQLEDNEVDNIVMAKVSHKDCDIFSFSAHLTTWSFILEARQNKRSAGKPLPEDKRHATILKTFLLVHLDIGRPHFEVLTVPTSTASNGVGIRENWSQCPRAWFS